MVVDLPAPFGPRKPVTRPGRAVKETSSTAVNPPYFLVKDSTVIMTRKPGRDRLAPVSGKVLVRPLIHP
jgi:hypothetical protein